MYVGATPSEYLVCTRRGQVDAKRSGQGRRIIKWPWLSVAVIPTTLQRIDFTADQITRERIGVSVTGIAVFRIAEPLLAFRVLNFDDGLATEKLAATMRDMFIGAARRLIANLSLEDCLTRRKEAIAGYLMDEIAPVVSGEGSPHDSTTTGWGVVIDTIEIQQVRIQSQQVFAHLQAPYRAEIAARAELADVARERQLADERAKIALRQIELAEAHRRAHAAAEIAALEVERGRIEATHLQTTLQLEQERQLELTRAEMKRRQAEEKDFESQLAAAHQRRLTEIENLAAQGRAVTNLVTHGLPKIAEALSQTYGTVNYTQIGTGSGGPLDTVPSAIAQLLALARSFGVEIPARSAKSPDGDS